MTCDQRVKNDECQKYPQIGSVKYLKQIQNLIQVCFKANFTGIFKGSKKLSKEIEMKTKTHNCTLHKSRIYESSEDMIGTDNERKDFKSDVVD